MNQLGLILIAGFQLLFINNLFPQLQKISSDDPEMKSYSMDWHTGNNTDFDLSYLLEKPAGKHGFIEIRNGHFYKPDGSRLRIWGVNLTGGACYPEKEDASMVAAYLARYGINGVRFHFLDSNWGDDKSIFDLSKNTTRELNPEQLDKLDYFINELKKLGIYTNINLNVGRHYLPGDSVPESRYLGFAKAATLFDDRLIMLQKEYARQLLTHKNPYTGNQYIHEPAVIIVEIVNENSLVEAWFDDRITGKNISESTHTWSGIPPYYARELTAKYNDWLNFNLSKEQRSKLEKEAAVNDGEMIPRMESNEFSKASNFRFHTEASFIIETESKFFSDMYHFLKVTLGVKAYIAGNSDHNHYKSGYALLSSLSKLDVVDGHVYWQHPNYILDPETGNNRITFHYTPMVNEPAMSTVVQLSRSAVNGKPFTVSETNHPYPSEFASEAIPILAAYGLLQDWDGIFYYTLEHDDPKNWNDKVPNPFDIYSDPVKMTNMAAGALMFHRNNLYTSDSVIYRDYNRNEIIEGIREDGKEKPYFTKGFNPVLPLIYKTRIDGFFKDHDPWPEFEAPNPNESQTGQLMWYHEDGNGLVSIESDQAEGLIGFVKSNPKSLDHLEADIRNSFCTVMLIAMDDKRIAESGELLLVTTATSGLSGMVYNESRTELLNWGGKPTLIEPVTGTITINHLVRAKSAEIISIDGNGMKIEGRRIKADPTGTLKFRIAEVTTPLYVIHITR
jgi:hypothetical protein